MKKIICAGTIVLMCIFSSNDAAAQSKEESKSNAAVARCHTVDCQVSLIVHPTASAKSRRLGGIANGKIVTLDGKSAGGNMVYPIKVKDPEGTYWWIKITKPIKGYVLYSIFS